MPTFPNAKVLATQADLDHARAQAERRPDKIPGFIWRETIQPLLDADCFVVVEPDQELDRYVRLRSTPGHTPGHVSVEIAAPKGPVPSGVAEGAAITGDLIHSPLQIADPLMSPSVDHDPELAGRTRQGFLETVSESGQLVLASHFPLPSAGYVRRRDGRFVWDGAVG